MNAKGSAEKQAPSIKKMVMDWKAKHWHTLVGLKVWKGEAAPQKCATLRGTRLKLWLTGDDRRSSGQHTQVMLAKSLAFNPNTKTMQSRGSKMSIQSGTLLNTVCTRCISQNQHNGWSNGSFDGLCKNVSPLRPTDRKVPNFKPSTGQSDQSELGICNIVT